MDRVSVEPVVPYRCQSRRRLEGSKLFPRSDQQSDSVVSKDELIPATGGKYQIVKKIVETTPPSAVFPALTLPDDAVKESVGRSDGIWYEPSGQRSYPKLLFSPQHGWREMSAKEVQGLDEVLPIAEYDPLTHPIKTLTSQDRDVSPYHKNTVPRRYDHNVKGSSNATIFRNGQWHDESYLQHEKSAQQTGVNGKPQNDKEFLGSTGSAFVDDIRHQQPRKIQIWDNSAIDQCGHDGTTKGQSDFWLLRTEPCDDNSAQGLVLLPNGEVLKFYGHPQLVTV
uniref:Ricin B-type lectin domain-containing protein n=1 Tax=Angiostrongylus cantonensis TaxID=6313 RepID=A0A158P5S4_ANGCA